MPVRDHDGIVLDTFNGLWKKGDNNTAPIDHFTDCNNIDFIGEKSFKTRDGIGISQQVSAPLSNVKRIYNYPTQTANTIILLTYDGTNGKIYHAVNPSTVFGPILTIAGMTDFAFIPYAGRGYISPVVDYVNGDLTFQNGMASQNVYVYLGDGTSAFQAAGAGPGAGTLTIANGLAGHTDAGFKIFGIVFQSSTGYNSPPGFSTSFTTAASNSVSFSAIPTGGTNIVKRLLVATKSIPTFNGNLNGYTFYFVPNAVISDNTTTVLNNISFYDADLLSDASHLLNNLTAIPAGSFMNLYHNRLVVGGSNANISLAYVSAPGEPEAVDSINGLIVVPLDGNPLTNGQELRDVLYLFKRSRTASYTDNGGQPASWPLIWIDNALGTCPHGIATVLDSGSANVDFLLVASYLGIVIFNGVYVIPELSWKIDNYWQNLDFKGNYGKIQMVNAALKKTIYCVLPSRNLLIGNYANGMDDKNIRWSKFSFPQEVNTVAIQDVNNIILGADYG